MRTVSFKIPVPLDDALTALANQRAVSRSEVLREAIELVTSAKRRTITAIVDELDLGEGGPADLSTNPKHLEGFGK